MRRAWAIALVLAACSPPPPEPNADVPSPIPHVSHAPTNAPSSDGAVADDLPLTTVARGAVYDAAGQPVGGGYAVRVKSLEPRAPYDRTVELVGARYAMTGVPTRAGLTITVTYQGKNVASRTLAPVTHADQDAVANFGGPATAEDQAGPSYPVPVAPASPVAAASPVAG